MYLVKGQWKKGTRIALQTESNAFFSDLSFEMGGNDEGFNPYELFLASLNAELIHSIRNNLFVAHKPIKEITIESSFTDANTMPINCMITLKECYDYDRNKIIEELSHCYLFRMIQNGNIHIEFI